MITKVTSSQEIKVTAQLAHEIWNEHYVPIIGQSQVDYMLQNLQSANAIKEQIESGYEYYLVFDNTSPVGYLGLRLNYPQGKLMISKIYVASTAQGKGYGIKLLEFTHKLALDNKLSSVWLTVNRHNSNTIKWYQKRGFRIVEEKKFDIGHGYVMDDYVLEVSTRKL